MPSKRRAPACKSATISGSVRSGWRSSKSATAPVTWGDDMLVPEAMPCSGSTTRHWSSLGHEPEGEENMLPGFAEGRAEAPMAAATKAPGAEISGLGVPTALGPAELK